LLAHSSSLDENGRKNKGRGLWGGKLHNCLKFFIFQIEKNFSRKKFLNKN